jgi:hypothetical protein
MTDLTPEELAEIIARYRYNSVQDRYRIERLTVENIELRKELDKLKSTYQNKGVDSPKQP